MQRQPDQTRVDQLLSDYGPDQAPKLPLDFGDYLSLLWRLDQTASSPTRVKYYRQCIQSVGLALGLKRKLRVLELSPPGEIYQNLPNLPYRSTTNLVDAQDRKAAILQLARLRDDILRVGAYHEQWGGGWPGSGILDAELRERVFAVLFTAFQGQFNNFGRLLLVVDIVLSNRLLGFESFPEVDLDELVNGYGYPDPNDERMRRAFYSE